jgi:thiamine-phosphate pyrophosphorylase
MVRPVRVPPLHVVTDDEVVARDDFLARAERIIQAGGPNLAFHLRAPRAGGRRIYELARALRDPVIGEDALLIVNDRVDVALASGADGVQVGGRGLEPAHARRLLGPDGLFGVSVHSADEARAAKEGGADYVLAGTIWETPSHPERRGAGIGLIRQIAALGIPTVAIGGVTVERAVDARDAGAAGVATIRGMWDTSDPAAAVKEYLAAWMAQPPVPPFIRVYVNGQAREVPNGLTLAGLLRHLAIDPAEAGVVFESYPIEGAELDRMPVSEEAFIRIVRVRLDGVVEEISLDE